MSCPLCVALYNLYMGGIDEADQLRGYYHIRLKNTKNYRYIFCFMFDVVTTNACILYSRFSVPTGTPMTLKQFRVKLAEQLIGSYRSRKRAGRPCPNLQVQHLTISPEEHTMYILP